MYVWGASPPSHVTGVIFLYIYIRVSVRHTTVYAEYFYLTIALRVNVKPPHCNFKGRRFCVSQFYPRLRFSATCNTTSSTDNHCPSALQCFQRLLNSTPYEYLRVRHRPAMCVSLPMNASCSASVLPSTHDYAYRACDTSTTANRIAPTRPKMLSIALVCMHAHLCVCLCVCMYIFSTYTPYSPSPGPASPVSKETPADYSGDVKPAHQDPITTMDTSQSVQYLI